MKYKNVLLIRSLNIDIRTIYEEAFYTNIIVILYFAEC